MATLKPGVAVVSERERERENEETGDLEWEGDKIDVPCTVWIFIILVKNTNT